LPNIKGFCVGKGDEAVPENRKVNKEERKERKR
jgi:hypothetical protein